jgi:O-antigen/teichoic acid export membrane protein
MSPESVQNLLALALGFAVAGLCSSAYRLATSRLPHFGLLTAPPRAAAVAALPLLILAAPFLIMRNTVLGYSQEGRRFEFVFLATLIAGFWSLMSGLVLVMALQACGLLVA